MSINNGLDKKEQSEEAVYAYDHDAARIHLASEVGFHFAHTIQSRNSHVLDAVLEQRKKLECEDKLYKDDGHLQPDTLDLKALGFTDNELNRIVARKQIIREVGSDLFEALAQRHGEEVVLGAASIQRRFNSNNLDLKELGFTEQELAQVAEAKSQKALAEANAEKSKVLAINKSLYVSAISPEAIAASKGSGFSQAK